jgi:iron complex transport system substrate-binding protein
MSGLNFKYALFCSFIFILCSCKNGSKEHVNSEFLRKDIKYAERFDLIQKEGYSLLIIKNPWQGAVNINETYYLITDSSRIPPDVDSQHIIRVPVKRIICTSTTHLSMISALGEAETIKGISFANYIYEKRICDLIENKNIADVGYDDNLNKELVIQISPDLVMVFGIGSESAGYISKLKELGIRILFNAEYLETDPLGKAEWIRVFGALYNKGKEADSIFSLIEDEYNRLKSYVEKNCAEKPSVLLGLPWKDTWFISPGNSYISRIISDAGGNYLWKNTRSDISMPFGLENVYVKALNADYWLNTGSINSLDEITAIDDRLCDLPSFRKGNVYNNNKRVSPGGGYDYWESGCINPQRILKDIAAIIHPELFPDYSLYYYKKIE